MGASETICYCFGYSREDIIDDYQQGGESKILMRIIAEKKSGGCECQLKNPTGK